MSKKPWDVRDPSPFGDIDENPLFNAIGRALTAWENVEVECARLFAVFVLARQKRTYHAPAVRAYGSIVGTHSRSKMLELAAEAYFARRPTRRINISNTQTDETRSLMGWLDEYSFKRVDAIPP